MKFLISSGVAALVCVGCTSSPTQVQGQGQSTPPPTTTVFPRSSVSVSLLKNQQVYGAESPATIRAADGVATIVVRFAGFPTAGRHGSFEKGQELYLWAPWTQFNQNGQGWLDETRFAQSYDLRIDKEKPKVYTFEVANEEGVYLDAKSAKLEGGLRMGDPVGTQGPNTRITFQLDFYGIRML